MSNIAIRRATPGDASAVASLLRELGYATKEDEVPQRLGRLAASRGTVLLAIRGPEIVGLATAHILSVINRPRDVAWLTALVVAESGRRLGVGRALVRAVEEFAVSQGCEWLSVTTHEARTDAQDFYRSIGLEQTGRRFGKALSPSTAHDTRSGP